MFSIKSFIGTFPTVLKQLCVMGPSAKFAGAEPNNWSGSAAMQISDHLPHGESVGSPNGRVGSGAVYNSIAWFCGAPGLE
jgi:hypothetical protein